MITKLTENSTLCLFVGLMMALPASATITAQDAGSYFGRTAVTGYGFDPGAPLIPSLLSRAQPGSLAFNDSDSGVTQTSHSSVDWSGAINVAANIAGQSGTQVLTVDIDGNADVHSNRDPNFAFYSAGGNVTVRGKVSFTLTEPACYTAQGSIDSGNEANHSESSMSVPGLLLTSVGSAGQPAFAPGPFQLQGQLLPGTYTIVGQAKESHTLGSAGTADDLRGQSSVNLHVVVTENCS